jgi:hypothetical protein
MGAEITKKRYPNRAPDDVVVKLGPGRKTTALSGKLVPLENPATSQKKKKRPPTSGGGRSGFAGVK